MRRRLGLYKKIGIRLYVDFCCSKERCLLSLSLLGGSFLSGSLFALSLSLCSSSFLSGLLCCGSEFSSRGSTLLSDSGSLCLVGLYLLSEEGLGSNYFLLSLSSADLTILSILLSLPSVETLLSLFLAKCTLSYTTVEVLHEHNALTRQDVACGVSRLCTYAYPVQCAIKLQINGCRIGVGVVRTDTFDDLAITWRAAVSYYNVVESVVLATVTSQTNLCCHKLFFVLGHAINTNRLSALIHIIYVLFTRKSVQRYGFFLEYTNISCIFHLFFVILQPISAK